MKFDMLELSAFENASEARQFAIDWQIWSGTTSLSYKELSHYQNYFERLGQRFGLIEEFKENGII